MATFFEPVFSKHGLASPDRASDINAMAKRNNAKKKVVNHSFVAKTKRVALT
ncbi:hypothetical protein NVP1238A_52 [Vibrio phage 1.238.A._10N.261.52.F10]|uniref:Uncharacterized protein n=1 Tax=Vibrio phage 1.238.A._10N.261.52.F10 TaxID=1881231 RepID=A0A2I7RUQ9_9CAUD|nr:hypothetical protein KNT79_gp52 [Vibrio phage 1.238.A._10N.261.52.F10]AUR97301.1 hypothetical protein NVP1238A_52 [Vibrio phage 1.238.A._10N.261.52.F10]AUR97395.1 hypothetical protein NVP1238B_53 [Vibrio phage 1.238.B._10N.261.52.F10]